MKDHLSNKHNFKQTRPVVILLPGSRQQEITNHLPYMLEAIQDDFFNDFEILLNISKINILKDFCKNHVFKI